MRYITHLSHLFLVIPGLKSELKSEIYFTVIPFVLSHYVHYGLKNDILTHTLYLKKLTLLLCALHLLKFGQHDSTFRGT